jgi:hypothetical protein
MKHLRVSPRKSFWITLSLAAAIGLPGTDGTASAADDKPGADKGVADQILPVPAKTTAPAEVVEPIAPSKAEIADSAFKKLDVSGKGYVNHEDVRGLDGFAHAFELADPQRTGKLSLAQFRKAWEAYTGH